VSENDVWVAFRISDVFLPGAAEVLQGVGEDTLVVGKVVAYSDSGSRARAFGVVELGKRIVIVASEKLVGIEMQPGWGTNEKE